MRDDFGDLTMDFNLICRTCLRADKDTLNIYTSYQKKNSRFSRILSYSEMLSYCTAIKPSQHDGLPDLICKECVRQLKKSYTFNEQCQLSDQKLKCYIETKREDTKHDVDAVFDRQTKENDLDCMKSLTEIENSTTSNDIKEEIESLLDSSNGGIKLEPCYNEDNVNCWDADDNVVLENIKTDKEINEPCYNEDNVNCWDADDNVVLENIKTDKEINGLDEGLSNKKKRGRSKKGLDKELSNKKKRGRSKKALVLEMGNIKSKSKLPHQCDICGKFLSNKSNLNIHKISHTELRPYKCDQCPMSYKGYSSLFQHKKCHTGERPYHCEYCTKRFKRKHALITHIRVHTGEKRYCCDICFKKFTQSAQLSIHMKRHKGDKSFLCQDCGKGFPIKADLKVHQRVHNGEKPYSCHMCTKTFATSGNLSIHIRIHNKEIRYNCDQCHRGFVTCSAYNVHLKRHKGQRDYQCECGKTFYTSSALKQHKVVHTGEKKYQCRICDKKFSQTSHLNRHFKKDHVKPNMPVPSSEQYRIVLNQDSFELYDGQKALVRDDVKCEGS